MPMKLQIVGSVVQARRSAACVNAAGTSESRKERMSVLPEIDSIGGRLVGSKVADAGSSASAAADASPPPSTGFASASLGSDDGSDLLSPSQSCFRRDPRDSKPSVL